jgi:hypothetical protein
MNKVELPILELGVIAVTRGMLGAGAGLLIADCMGERRRKAIGRILLTIGVLSTIPLALDVLSKRRKKSGAATRERLHERVSEVSP